MPLPAIRFSVNLPVAFIETASYYDAHDCYPIQPHSIEHMSYWKIIRLHLFGAFTPSSGSHRRRKPIIVATLLLGAIVGLSGCSSEPSGEERVKLGTQQVSQQLSTLKSALDNGQVRNALFLSEYARIIKSGQPNLATLADNLALDATTKGPMYQGLESRLSSVSDIEKSSFSWTEFPDWQARLSELSALRQAASVPMFNDALSDPVNVLADMSKGQLARVNAISAAAEQRSNASGESSAGKQLVGNPNYGHWQSSSGGSFWAWYGQYAMLSSLLGGGRNYYGSWAGGRGYSYYHDVGRNRYSSPGQRNRTAQVANVTKKQYRNSGKRFTSPYSKTRTGASGLSRASSSQSKAVFTSPYSKKSSGSSSYKSSYSSPSRSSSSRSFSGFSRGK